MSRPIHEALWHWSSDFDADAIIAVRTAVQKFATEVAG
jgi:hypothetical protein